MDGDLDLLLTFHKWINAGRGVALSTILSKGRSTVKHPGPPRSKAHPLPTTVTRDSRREQFSPSTTFFFLKY